MKNNIKWSYNLHAWSRYELQWLVENWASPVVLYKGLAKEAHFFLQEEADSRKCSGFQTKNLSSQPIEEIRNYFGEQIALYFAFARIYIHSLIWPSFFGAMTMVGHVQDGVEGNPLSLAYAIYISFWAVGMGASWNKRQAELMFLWGTDRFEELEPPRKGFRMVISQAIWRCLCFDA